MSDILAQVSSATRNPDQAVTYKGMAA
jgi:hypothetical protein